MSVPVTWKVPADPISRETVDAAHGRLLIADPSSLPSGWSGTPGHLSCWQARLMATPGCGRSQMVTARLSRAPTVQLPVAVFSLMVRAAALSFLPRCKGRSRVLTSLSHGQQAQTCSQTLSHYHLLPDSPGGVWVPSAFLPIPLPCLVCLSVPSVLLSLVPLALREESCGRL
jgi:hypothetical protein